MAKSKQLKLPWQKWSWDDWFTSVDVQSLPRDTQQVWFSMLGRMWNSSERGFLTINGKPMSDAALASLLGFGTDVKEWQRHLKLIEDAGLFSRRESDNAIFSRKILHDEGIREQKAVAGRFGGLVTQRQRSASQVVHDPNDGEVLGYPGEPTEEEKLRANAMALAGVRE